MEYISTEVRYRKHSSQYPDMKSEWSRFQSFIAFPVDSVARPLRLAHAGYYYTGSGEEVVCFCCGLRNDVWTEDETVLEVHRRLSPHCRYICGGDTTNIAIHGENRLKTVPNSFKDSAFTTEHETHFTHSKFEKAKSENERGNNDSSTCTAEQSNETYEDDRNVCVSGISTQHASLKNPAENHVRTNQEYDMKPKTVSMVTNGQIELYPGISHSRPKHSDYALISERLGSFAGWPAQHFPHPAVLAKAGFYYAGGSDCVRCFFCSVGMKNWQSGDNPWVEHAKWSPDCAYVKHCKGETFVRICHAAVNTDLVAVYDNESQLDEENIPEDWLIQNVNSAAAKLVLSMGYSQDDVEKGVLSAREKYGSTEIKAQYIMEYMREDNVQRATQQVSSVNETYSEERKDKSPNAIGNVTEKKNQRSTVGYKHKTEKQRLLEENRKLKNLMTCKICLDNDACVAFLPCGHLTSCVECSKSLRKCAICRAVVQGTVRVYQA